MNRSKPPKFDSISELAEFWDTHDVTDFETELQEASEPVFVRPSGMSIALDADELHAVERIAKAQGISREELVRGWVVRELQTPPKTAPSN